jgi:hypothetical protein
MFMFMIELSHLIHTANYQFLPNNCSRWPSGHGTQLFQLSNSPARWSPMEAWGKGHRGLAAEEARSTAGWQCGIVGWGQGISSPVLLAPWWRYSGGGDEGAAMVASKTSWHGGGGGSEGVPRRWRWWRWRGAGSCGDDGVPVVAACAPVASLMVVRRR